MVREGLLLGLLGQRPAQLGRPQEEQLDQQQEPQGLRRVRGWAALLRELLRERGLLLVLLRVLDQPFIFCPVSVAAH